MEPSSAMPPSPQAQPLRSAELWDEFRARLQGFVARRVDDPHDADDILQDIFVKAHQRLSTVRDEDRVGAWLFQIARRTIIDHYRSAPSRRELPTEHIEGPEREPSPEERFDDQGLLRREMASCLRPLLGQLTPRLRKALELTDLGGMSQVQAARHTGTSLTAMKSRVQRGRRELYALIQQACEVQFDARGAPIGYAPDVDRCSELGLPTHPRGCRCSS